VLPNRALHQTGLLPAGERLYRYSDKGACIRTRQAANVISRSAPYDGSPYQQRCDVRNRIRFGGANRTPLVQRGTFPESLGLTAMSRFLVAVRSRRANGASFPRLSGHTTCLSRP
jgi:hypothetical protein